MLKNLKHTLLPAVVMMMLLAGGVRMFLLPKEMNTYENRYANQLGNLTVSSFLEGDYQDSMENALADQIPFAQHGKKFYNLGSTVYIEGLAAPVYTRFPDRYFNYRGLGIYGGNALVRYVKPFSSYQAQLDAKIANYNEIFAQFPDMEFYAYYVGKDTDISFDTGAELGVYTYLAGGLNLAPERMHCYRVDDFETYRREFYLTDHHWNHRGSYRGYLEALDLLGITEAPMTPSGELVLEIPLVGSKANEVGSLSLSETMTISLYDWPAMDITVNGEPVSDYGVQNKSVASAPSVSYGLVYGWDMGEVTFSTHRPDRESILVIGESYDNAILKLLATHFDNVYSIDLRYYENYMGQPFCLGDYLQSHRVDKVLLIGNISFYTGEDFLLEG